MSILETVTVFVGGPAAIFAAIAGVVYAAGGRPARRYRPGRPYEFAPVWFVAASNAPSANGRNSASAALEGSKAKALTAEGSADQSDEQAEAAKGGARGTW